MTCEPADRLSVAITLSPPVLPAVVAGRCTALRRPAGGNLDRALHRAHQPARRLWIREPFHLPARFGGDAPLQALARGAAPIFPDDVRIGRNADIGPRRIPYTLPRAWHRQHLRVLAVERQRLQAITDAEIRAEGWANRGDYARAWNRALQVCGFSPGSPESWEGNPLVLVITFEHVARSVSAEAAARSSREAAARQRSAALEGAL